jgi:hypothetical protein
VPEWLKEILIVLASVLLLIVIGIVCLLIFVSMSITSQRLAGFFILLVMAWTVGREPKPRI